MATFKEISAADIKTSRSALNQLVDIIQEDVSGSITRKSYEVFVTGGVGPGVTSSLFQTVYDQDFTLQSANAIFDMSVGLNPKGDIITNASTGEDSSGKKLFPSSSLMMREKMYVYKQFAQTLLGDADAVFTAPFTGTDDASASDNEIECAMFIGFKRLFARDKIKRETFAMRFYQSASISGNSEAYASSGVTGAPGSGYYGSAGETGMPSAWDGISDNIFTTSTGSVAIYTDIGSSTSKRATFGGEVGNIVNSYNTDETVGILFYDAGVAVLDINKMWQGDQPCMGVIDGMNNNEHEFIGVTGGASGAIVTVPCGKVGLGYGGTAATFYPDFLVNASTDDIVDHLASARFQSGTLTAMTFQNITNINSTLIFCRATADEFNYSSNPTYVDNSDRVVVIDEGQEDTQRSFTFPTTVGLYDANDNLLAVAKMSRPIEKNDEKDVTVRVRLDF